jgi:hypothetical protein
MGIRKYLSKTILQSWKYQQLWKRNVDYFKPYIPLDFGDLSPSHVSFCEKKTLDVWNF